MPAGGGAGSHRALRLAGDDPQSRKWERYQSVEETLRRYGVEAPLLSADLRRHTPAVLQGWDWTSFGAHDKAHQLELYAANLEEAARHFWE